MTSIKAYFDRIQGRLFLAFAIAFAGTLTIFFVSALALSDFATQVEERIEELRRRGDLARDLEASVIDQLSAGQEFLLTGAEPARLRFDSLYVATQATRDEFVRLPNLAENELDRLREIREIHTALTREHEQAQAALAAGNRNAALARASTLAPQTLQLRTLIRALAVDELNRFQRASNQLQTDVADRQNMLLVILIITSLIFVAFAYFTLRAIERPLNRLVLAANQFGSGDLQVSVNGRMPDEFRVLAAAFTGMADRFRVVVGETVKTANKISASAADLSSISEEVAASSGEVSTAMVGITSGAEEQAFGIRSVDEALEDMKQRANEIGTSSERVREVSRQIGDLASTRRKDVGRAISMLLDVREVVRTSGAEVNELQRASERISNFVETIGGIARQTNLLALNAAIEAARAGEHGRGFGVVADEVRKLADESARAADEVSATVRHIRKQIDTVVITMERGFASVSNVEEASKGAEQAFEEIVAAVTQVSDAASRVAQSAEENRKAVHSVEENVRAVGATAESHAASAQQVSAAAQEQSAATEELSAASLELLHAAETLKELVSGFRI